MNLAANFYSALAAGHGAAAATLLEGGALATGLVQELQPFGKALTVPDFALGSRFLSALAKGKTWGAASAVRESSTLQLRRAVEILRQSGGATAPFFESHPAILEKVRSCLGPSSPTTADTSDGMSEKILEMIARHQKLCSQHEKTLKPGQNPLPSAGFMAPWFVTEKQMIVDALLADPTAAINALFECMKEPNPNDLFAATAISLAAWLAEKTPQVYQQLLSVYPSAEGRSETEEIFAKRLLEILVAAQGNLHARAVLDRLHMKCPDDRILFDWIRKRAFLSLTDLNIQPKKGRDHIVVAAVSDLHHSLENARNVMKLAGEVKELDPDILIIAGDVANGHDFFQSALELFRGTWRTLVVAGNHDVWSPRQEVAGGPTSEELWEKLLPEKIAAAGAIDLERQPVFIRSLGLAIVGTIGWYDYSGDRLQRSAEQLAATKNTATQDGVRINWSWSDQEFSRVRRENLEFVLENLSRMSDVKTMLVATHMVPFAELQSETEKNQSGAFFDRRSPYYFVPTLGEVIRKFPKVRLTVSGHNHLGAAAEISRPGMDPIHARVIAEEDRSKSSNTNEIVFWKFPSGS